MGLFKRKGGVPDRAHDKNRVVANELQTNLNNSVAMARYRQGPPAPNSNGPSPEARASFNEAKRHISVARNRINQLNNPDAPPAPGTKPLPVYPEFGKPGSVPPPPPPPVSKG